MYAKENPISKQYNISFFGYFHICMIKAHFHWKFNGFAVLCLCFHICIQINKLDENWKTLVNQIQESPLHGVALSEMKIPFPLTTLCYVHFMAVLVGNPLKKKLNKLRNMMLSNCFWPTNNNAIQFHSFEILIVQQKEEDKWSNK